MGPRGHNQKFKRSFLSLKQKQDVIYELRKDYSYSQIMARLPFKISKGQISAISKNKENIISEIQLRTSSSHTKVLKPKYPEIDHDVKRLVTWLRDQHVPVSMSLLIQHAKMSAEKNNIACFKASNGWVARFLRRNNIQGSLRLHGKAGDFDPTNYTDEIRKIRETMDRFDPKNIYNEDESGLLFRMIPNRSYLAGNENRSLIRGTSQMRRKERISAVFCTNADGSHKLPVFYISRSCSPRCFLDHQDLKPRYTNQKNAWMDGSIFKQWLQLWYAEVQTQSDGPWLLLLDNCSGHSDLPVLQNVTYMFLPPNTTAVYQPLDQGLISMAKKKYRALFLRKIVEVLVESMSANQIESQPQIPAGRAGLQEGQLPHVADAMRLLDEAWDSVSPCSVMKCWIKSTCLPEQHQSLLRDRIDFVNNVTSDGSDNASQELQEAVLEYSNFNGLALPDTPISGIAHDLVQDGPANALALLDNVIPGEERLQVSTPQDQVLSLFESQEQCSPPMDSNPQEPDRGALTNPRTSLQAALGSVSNLDPMLTAHVQGALDRISSMEHET